MFAPDRATTPHVLRFFDSDPNAIDVLLNHHHDCGCCAPDDDSYFDDDYLYWTQQQHSRMYEPPPAGGGAPSSPGSISSREAAIKRQSTFELFDPFGYTVPTESSPYDTALHYAHPATKNRLSSFPGSFSSTDLAGVSLLRGSTAAL